MSDQSHSTGGGQDQPLFQHMDEQERMYAPDQVPGTGMPPNEIDANTGVTDAGGAGGTGAADRHGTDAPSLGVMPAVPAGGVTGSSSGIGSSAPLVVPVVPPQSEVDEEDRRQL